MNIIATVNEYKLCISRLDVYQKIADKFHDLEYRSLIGCDEFTWFQARLPDWLLINQLTSNTAI